MPRVLGWWAVLNEGCSVESREGARRWEGVVERWKRSKSCVKFGCGVGPAEAGGGSHVCCCEAVVDGGWGCRGVGCLEDGERGEGPKTPRT